MKCYQVVTVPIALFGLLVLGILGCRGGSVPSGPAVEVSGVVLAEGQPLSHGSVEFQSEDYDSLVCLARVEDGKFAIDESRGLVEGDYTVRIVPFEPEVEELGQIPAEKRLAINAARKLIPEKYQKVGAIRQTLSSGQVNQVTYEMKR